MNRITFVCRRFGGIFLCVLATAFLNTVAERVEAEEASYTLATASTGGTYYPVGVALSTLVKVKLEPREKIGMSAISSAGSADNVRLMGRNEAQFGIMQGLYGYFSATGSGPMASFGPQDNLRSVTMLWQNVEQFVVDTDAVVTGTIEDLTELKGEAVAFGRRNSGTIGSTRMLLAPFGIDIDENYSLVFGGYGPSAEALQNGQVRAISMPAGVPVGALSRLFASRGSSVEILSFTPEQAAIADQGLQLWTPYTIEAGSYPGQSEAVETIAQPNFLAVNADVSADNVYRIVKTIYENLPFLQAIHPAVKVMHIDKAITGLPLPLHPGALRYYEEVGLTIPEHLIAR